MRADRSSGSFEFAWVHSNGRLIYSGSRGFTQTLILVAEIIRFRVGSLRRDRGRRIHSDSRAFTRGRLAVVGFIRVRVGSLGHA